MMSHPTASSRQRCFLHVGSGLPDPDRVHPAFRKSGWREIRLDIDPRVEPDIVANITAMPEVPDASMDGIWSAHNLEHLLAHEVPLALREFYRVLIPGGALVLVTPDLQAVAEHLAAGKLDEPLYQSGSGPVAAVDICFGFRTSTAQGNYFMAHKTGFTAQTLTDKLAACGFRDINIVREPGLILEGVGYKPRQS